ncbi:MAG TPA: hypothetical protein VKN74_03220 [Candidatus Mcinerneyibacterium sp.]|nr:hypothetical protein [Candidatus Mcinerneyibacterium sp.]
MKNKFLIFLLIFLSLLSTGCQSKKINNFSELITAIKSGTEIKVRIHYGKCNLFSKGKKIKNSPEAIGGMTLDVFEYFAKNSIGNKKAYIAASKNNLINYKNKNFFYNFVKIRIYENNHVEITAKYLTRKDLEPIMSEIFKTTINNGNNNGGVFLYK